MIEVTETRNILEVNNPTSAVLLTRLPAVQLTAVAQQGLQGPAGPGASALDSHYTHTQLIASATWSVVHNLGKYPSVMVVDSGNNVVVGDIQYTSVNALTITFNAAFGGSAYIN